MNRRATSDSAILIDSNLAILLCVGLSGTENIAKHKRLSGYDATDFLLLKEVLTETPRLAFSPYMLSETSNLLRQTHEPIKRASSLVLKQLVIECLEEQLSAKIAVLDPYYDLLGVTDAALLGMLASNEKLTLLTADLDLYLVASSRGHKAINFANVRGERPDFQ